MISFVPTLFNPNNTINAKLISCFQVNLHEGCGRAKLFWLTAAADAATLKGMIEFKDEGNKKGSSGGFVEAVCR